MVFIRLRERISDQMKDVRPLIPESSTSESTTVEVTLSDLSSNLLRIPDYQRDSGQWNEPTQSLLIESVINNLSVPAFFFEVRIEEGVEINEVVDGQQRLTTLAEFFKNKLRLVDSAEAPYLSPNSVLYAGKTFDELPQVYQQAFKKYRLTVIKLRGLGDMRLEVFRRINQGGTPLSGQDIRLAYYGEKSKTLSIIRLAGIFDTERLSAKRFIENAKLLFQLEFPWKSSNALSSWRDWWEDKEIARGQTPSESFLWSIVCAQVDELDSILQNDAALQKLNVRFNRAIDEALDACCAQLSWQDLHPSLPPALFTFDDIQDKFFPYFEIWIHLLIGVKGLSLPVTKHRTIASIIGAAYKNGIDSSSLKEKHWTKLVEFARRPQDFAKGIGCEWPLSKGKWDGQRGYRSQQKAAHEIIARICS
jgi:hypothetical protein